MKNCTLIKFQYLGFRFHGFQKQTKHATIQSVLEKCIDAELGADTYSLVGASRTDSMVSACESYFLLSSDGAFNLTAQSFNNKLPPDIRILEIKPVATGYTMIKASQFKEYHYYFCSNQQMHPYAAPLMASFNEPLNIPLMQEAARCFEGVHHFKNYCYRPRENQNFERQILHSSLEENTTFTASFFPDKSFVFKVRAKSFMRHQVRIMAGALVLVGLEKLSLEEFKKSLTSEFAIGLMIAPASGLHLIKTGLDDEFFK